MYSLAFVVILVAVAATGMNFFFLKDYVVHRRGAILITGTSSGIGLDAAQALAALGYTVFGTVRKEADFPILQAAGCIPLVMSMENEESMKEAVAVVAEWTEKEKLPFVALINNAGISMSMPIEFVPMDRARNMFEVNLFGLMRLTQLALPHLRKSRGRIVNVGSVAGVISTPNHGTYSASKAALESITDALRLELWPHGVAVVMVEPGYVQTAIGDKGLSDDQPFRHATPEQKKVYPKFFAYQERSRRGQFSDAPYSNTTTTPVIIEAVRSPTPQPRYIVAGVGSMPAWVAIRIFSFVPTPFRDYLIEKLRG